MAPTREQLTHTAATTLQAYESARDAWLDKISNIQKSDASLDEKQAQTEDAYRETEPLQGIKILRQSARRAAETYVKFEESEARHNQVAAANAKNNMHAARQSAPKDRIIALDTFRLADAARADSDHRLAAAKQLLARVNQPW